MKTEKEIKSDASAFISAAKQYRHAQQVINSAKGRHKEHGLVKDDGKVSQVTLIHKGSDGKTASKAEKAAEKFKAATDLLISTNAIPGDVWAEALTLADEQIKAEAAVARQMAEARKNEAAEAK